MLKTLTFFAGACGLVEQLPSWRMASLHQLAGLEQTLAHRRSMGVRLEQNHLTRGWTSGAHQMLFGLPCEWYCFVPDHQLLSDLPHLAFHGHLGHHVETPLAVLVVVYLQWASEQ